MTKYFINDNIVRKRNKMRTFSRRGAAKQLGVSMNHLLYWEKKDKLRPEKIRAGDNTLVIYTPELIKKAEEILNRKKEN